MSGVVSSCPSKAEAVEIGNRKQMEEINLDD